MFGAIGLAVLFLFPSKDFIDRMKRTVFAAMSAFGLFLMVSAGLFAQPQAGKTFAKIGDWEVRKFPKYCVASVGFEGDRGLRISSGADSFSIGFMGAGTAAVPAKTPVTYWFDNNKAAKFTRTAVKRSNVAEDGGTPWLIFVDPASEPSHAGDFETAKTLTFTYKANGATQTETFSLKNGKTAYAKVFQCSGQ